MRLAKIIRNRGNEHGFSLVEVMVAMVILAVGILGYLAVHYQSTGARVFVQNASRAIVAENSEVERILSEPPPETATTDTAYDGFGDDWTYEIQWEVRPLAGFYSDSEVAKRMKSISSNTSWEVSEANRQCSRGQLFTFYPYGNR
jgi:prepilin-type N-terminal cleavage/methylation domain-containing protein